MRLEHRLGIVRAYVCPFALASLRLRLGVVVVQYGATTFGVPMHLQPPTSLSCPPPARRRRSPIQSSHAGRASPRRDPPAAPPTALQRATPSIVAARARRRDSTKYRETQWDSAIFIDWHRSVGWRPELRS